MLKTLKISILLFLSPFLLFSQNFELSESTEISISGTSSLHDWTMTAEEFTGTADFIVEGNKIKDINSLEVTINAESLKSGKSGMDKNTYKALKTDKYENIAFTLTEGKVISTIGNVNKVSAKGKLTVAGQTRIIEFVVDCKVQGDIISCSGTEDMKMTDFEVEPPTAMFGTIKTGDKITVNFNVQFSDNKLSNN